MNYVFWENHNYYREKLKKFNIGELTNSELIDKNLYPILSNKNEAEDLRTFFPNKFL